MMTTKMNNNYNILISKNPILSPEEESILSNIILNGNNEEKNKAINKLISSNIRLAIKIVTNDFSWFRDQEDLISEAIIALQHAAKKYNSNLGKFSTYAPFFIKARIIKYITNSQMIPMGSSTGQTYNKIQNILKKLNHEPSDDELANLAGISKKRLRNILNYKYSFLPLDKPSNIDSNIPLHDTIKDSNTIQPDQFAQNNSNINHINSFFSVLNDREQFILKKRFGFDGNEPMILEDIGSILNITRERTRQLQNRALQKIKENFPQLSLISI